MWTSVSPCWMATRWPTFVELCLVVVDDLIPAFGHDVTVFPLGAEATAAALLEAGASTRPLLNST
jgi:hypothetical protein